MKSLLMLLVGFGAGYWMGISNIKDRKSKSGEGFINRQTDEKKENKERILEYLQGKEGVGNDEVEKLLGVSDATATRYLEELEKEEKILQIGKEGRFVKYKLK